MKELTVLRGLNLDPLKLESGDVFDSSAVLRDGSGFSWRSDHVNTDATLGYQGGRLALGNYYGIVGYRANGKRVIKLFRADITRLGEIKTADDLNIDDMTLRSEIPNKNHEYSFIVQYVQVHSCGMKNGPEPTWDWSHACITVYNHNGEYDDLMAVLQDNEIITVNLIK